MRKGSRDAKRTFGGGVSTKWFTLSHPTLQSCHLQPVGIYGTVLDARVDLCLYLLGFSSYLLFPPPCESFFAHF